MIYQDYYKFGVLQSIFWEQRADHWFWTTVLPMEHSTSMTCELVRRIFIQNCIILDVLDFSIRELHAMLHSECSPLLASRFTTRTNMESWWISLDDVFLIYPSFIAMACLVQSLSQRPERSTKVLPAAHKCFSVVCKRSTETWHWWRARHSTKYIYFCNYSGSL